MDKNLFFYELEGRGYIFQNKKWDEAKHGFEDDMLNMAWEMWSSAKHSVKAQAVPELCASVEAHKIIIDEVKTEINDGYDLCQDSYLLDVLVHRGIQIGKAQAVPEGFVLVPVDQLNQWGHMANYAEQYGCPECFEARGYAHNLACEINSYFEPVEAQEQKG